MEPIIKVEGLSKYFGGAKSLDNLNFHVGKGEIFGFLGPSGAGKTTAVKILTGQLRSTSGSAAVFGVEAERINTPQHLKRIGVMTDNSGLYTRLNVYENLKFFASLYGIFQADKRIDTVLEMVALQEEKKKQISKLSRGMTQRVILARALLHEPDLLFLDEPTAALDPASKRHIHRGLQRLNAQGTTIFMTTHDMEEAEHLCGRIAFLYDGAVQEEGSPQQIRRSYADNTFTIELRNGEKHRVSKSAAGAETAAALLKTDEVASVYPNDPTLGDIFVQMTGRELV
ncbi:ABC transporter ATP-binding protein [Alkalicoccus saliphilus]|uniref:Bacitracin ABC transporter ATP-binding protein n=1 Tax=Alkalicoccus saliphilus TaxID=200989 RepID=A0A2T4U1P3_9BACI|nr:ABC transporter ATP-binding protein [Alkalicoccus saliphilus]PTL37317.1 bacitracin ABC transporter ATP-binding protein [Alkalicoccus saliphilus]